MIISFDGNVFTGKSSLIRKLAEIINDANVIGEHGDFLISNTHDHSATKKEGAQKLQELYLDAEKRRASNLRPDINLLDRSFVSMAAHIYALYVLHEIDLRKWFIEEILNLIKDNKILIPDVYVYIRCDIDLIRERASRDVGRGTKPIYIDEDYLKIIDKFNSTWTKLINGMTIDTSAIDTVVLAETLIKQIPLNSRADPHGSETIRCLKQALEL